MCTGFWQTLYRFWVAWSYSCAISTLCGPYLLFVVAKPVLVSSLEYCDQLLDRHRDLSPDIIVYRYVYTLFQHCMDVRIFIHRVSFVEKFGTRYSKGSVVFCAIDDDTPIFGKITDIVVPPSGDCLFSLIPYVGTYFCSHYNAYELNRLDQDCLLCSPKDLVDHHTLSISKSFSRSLSHKSFLCLKYHV